LSWLRIVEGGGHLWLLKWTLGFPKTRGISWLAEERLASQDGLCCMEFVKTTLFNQLKTENNPN
jgi:hypothetical protein